MTEEHDIPEELDRNLISNETEKQTDLGGDAVGMHTVEVQIKKIAERQRQITATIQIPDSVEKVWKVLTDYETLPDFVPNLAKSRLLEHPKGGIRLEQVGSQRFLRFNFCARVVLDIEEHFPKEIYFSMVEGDFRDFSGSWQLQPCVPQEDWGTCLCYTVKVWPKVTMPVGMIERRLSEDMQTNLLAIRQRVKDIFVG
ncbi:MAG: SRPBCC family protein [Scytonema sp. PMC 1069.18]|nr:SRPBCC family protein [Scytonema sp. PMC 1069.18]MEC4881233.1 SRPBCC family protein [Scytonema sp. PMC 1070.18]